MNFLHDFTLFVVDIHQIRLISLFQHFSDHFHPTLEQKHVIDLRPCHTRTHHSRNQEGCKSTNLTALGSKLLFCGFHPCPGLFFGMNVSFANVIHTVKPILITQHKISPNHVIFGTKVRVDETKVQVCFQRTLSSIIQFYDAQ